jgi:type IV pilus assembly protein PilQ
MPMKPARILSAVMAAVLLQSNVAWSQMVPAAAAKGPDDFPEPVASTGTARLTGLDSETTEGLSLSTGTSFLSPLDGPPSARLNTASPRPGLNALVESLNAEPIDFNFKNADLLGILRSFAVKFNKNIIAAPGVGGKVNMQLRGVPFDEAFRIMLDELGLVAIQKSDSVIEIIKVVNMPVLVQVYPLKYRFALELQTALLTILDKKEKENTIISVDSASNSLIVTSTNDTLHKMKVMISQLDIASPQIAIKARLIEVQATNSLTWGINWAGSTNFGRGGTVRSIKDQSNYTVNQDGSLNTTQATTQAPLGGILDVSSVMNKTTLYALLNFLKADAKTKTISEPMVLTGNNKTAKIHVGQNLPVKISQVTQTATTQTVQYIPEGVDLEVTPIVSPGSSVISFKIRVGVSEFVGFQDNNPITTERVATTEVSVETGMTVVIGGLIKDKLIDSESGIPFLKDIPILGWLFKNKKKSKDRTELLIFITPELQPRSV